MVVGKPHAGLLPIRGHSNVQGVGSMGVAPNLKEQPANFKAMYTPEFGDRLFVKCYRDGRWSAERISESTVASERKGKGAVRCRRLVMPLHCHK